jgi:O-antigen/teichoic acid export membrane protein
MVYFDRFLIGAVLTAAAVAYYATPYEVVTKLWIVPGALLGVFFPAFAASYLDDRERLRVLFDQAIRVVYLLLFPIVLVLVALAEPGLTLWLGTEFSVNSSSVLRLLAIGVFINSIGQVPFALLQGIGRPDVTGKLHLLELPLYLAGMYWLTVRYGIEGAAIAWVARVALDSLILFVVVYRLLPDLAAAVRVALLRAVVALQLLLIASLPGSSNLKLLLLAAALPAFLGWGWFRVLTPVERAFIRRPIGATGRG